MKTKSKKFVLLGSIIIAFGALLLGAGYFLFFTNSGGLVLTERFAKLTNDENLVDWEQAEGSLVSGMLYKNIVLENLKWFPIPNQLKVQTLIVNIHSLSLNEVELQIDNARLILPDADPVLFRGKIEKGSVDFNLYSKSISDGELKDLLKADVLSGVKGSLSEVDVFIKGSVDQPLISGEFVIEKITKNGFFLEKAPGEFKINIKNDENVLGLHGLVILKGGTIHGNKTALVRLQESKIMFNGDPQKPSFNIKATSVVERIKIDIAVKGSLQNPDLQVSSDSPMAKERLLLALATNRTWKDSEELLNKGEVSADLSKDFIDYFLFGGQGDQFAQKLGLRSFSVKYDAQGKGIAVTKDLADGLEASYEIEERSKVDQKPDVSQKVGGEYKVTDAISVGAQKEFITQEKKDLINEKNKSKTDDRVYLKYKKGF
ncbi:MAG: translocation/assembly module TamB domain-containing protein [Candidatus Omnitrophica bacterium]|nr:translocation/assembly module TamB domain-containing protein [Candidatus Omnitrophota bacterium]